MLKECMMCEMMPKRATDQQLRVLIRLPCCFVPPCGMHSPCSPRPAEECGVWISVASFTSKDADHVDRASSIFQHGQERASATVLWYSTRPDWVHRDFRLACQARLVYGCAIHSRGTDARVSCSESSVDRFSRDPSGVAVLRICFSRLG